ncbi:pentapeptide repeat protein [Nocardiopsis sp. Huas11]|uniref:pentapeptide repeat-containing protein n=1 Tax=Nocardiopsis sp. Huas11 TaxID=2183912 RepID=UPI000F135518|nr:pentapeptide repeat-containing protein [Nocardiopsis sp. Huas11]RKS06696.1 pentapeptide repeat protein [Nocardiopsis sp. Huas11]
MLFAAGLPLVLRAWEMLWSLPYAGRLFLSGIGLTVIALSVLGGRKLHIGTRAEQARLGSVIAVAWIVVAALVALIVTGTWWVMGSPQPLMPDQLPPRALDAIATRAFAVVAGLGAAALLVISYRRQRTTERGDQREVTKLFTERFDSASEKLGSEHAAVRLAGVHALAHLADDAPEGHDELVQMVIDVLCAYLRMPYRPEPNELYEESTPEQREAYEEQALTFASMREVRQTIIRVIGNHLSTDTRWVGKNYDFTGAKIDGGDFRGASFTGGDVIFDDCVFAGGVTKFKEAQFTGGRVSFDGATFKEGVVSFDKSIFSEGRISFEGAHFLGGVLEFGMATFRGSYVSFAKSKISRSVFSFHGAKFEKKTVTFRMADFSDGEVLFSGSDVKGGRVSFIGAKLQNSVIRMGFSKVTAGVVDFSQIKLLDSTVEFHISKLLGGQVKFQSSRLESGKLSFRNALLEGCCLDFVGAELGEDVVTFKEARMNGGRIIFAKTFSHHEFEASGYCPIGLIELAEGGARGTIDFPKDWD